MAEKYGFRPRPPGKKVTRGRRSQPSPQPHGFIKPPSPAAQRQGNTPASRRARPRILRRQQQAAQRQRQRTTRQQARRTFAPGTGQAPLKVLNQARQKAARKVVKNLLSLPSAPRAPQRPTLTHYTSPQLQELATSRARYKAKAYSHVTRGGAKAGPGNFAATRQVTDRLLRGAYRTPQFEHHISRIGRQFVANARTEALKQGFPSLHAQLASQSSATPAHIKHTGPGGLIAAATDVFELGAGHVPSTPQGQRLATVPYQVARAFAEDPGKVTSASLRTAKESITGLPQAAKMLVSDPGKALHEIGKDYERRYGSLLEGDSSTFRKRIKQDYGITPYALDTAAAAGGGGRLLGLAARSESAGRLIAAAEKARPPVGGRIVRAAKAVQTATREDYPRPKLRISGGEAGAQTQRVSKNLFVAGTQRIIDRRRAAKFAKEAEHAGLQRTAAGKLEPIPGAPQRPLSAGKGRFGALRPGEGEVLPYASAREAPVLSRYMGRTERALGHRKSMERQRLLMVGGDVEKQARKALKKLDSSEKDSLKYVMQLGLTPKNKGAAVAALKSLRDIHAAGRAEELNVPKLEPDELPVIDRIIAEPDKYITENVRNVADELRAIEHTQAAADPALATEQAATRRVLPQSMVLEKMGADTRRRPDVGEFHHRLTVIEQKLRDQGKNPGDLVKEFGHLGEFPPEQRLPAVRELERALRLSKGKAERAVETAKRHVAKAQGRIEGARSIPLSEFATRATQKAPRAAEDLRAGKTEARDGVLSKRAERDDVRIRHAVAAHLKGELKTRPGTYEDYATIDKRVTSEAERAGLEAPAYFESSGGADFRRSLKAIGTGIRASAGTKAYSGARFLAGRESGDPEIIVNGLLRNAKRRFSWRFTVNTIEQSAFEWSRGPSGGGLTAKEITRELEKRGINPDDIEIVNPRILHDRELNEAGIQRGQVDDPSVDASPTGGIHPQDLAMVQRGLDEAKGSKAVLREGADLVPGQTRGVAQNRYVVLPQRDYMELAAATRPDSFAARSFDILWKQKPARILLGLANTSWLAFQMMANGFVAGLAGARNPFDYLAAQRYWRKLTPEQKLAIEPELGITHHHHPIGDETHLGAATNNRFVNAWRAFKQTKAMRTAHKANPLDAMFRVDEAQNNFFRRTVFYNQAKRAAYRRMGKTWKNLNGDHEVLTKWLDQRDPQQRMDALLNHADDFQRAAQHTREFLGDYLTFTSRERQTISRAIMFYGYLRFSLRFTFWTMPVKHPIMTAILSDLGRMGSQEVKRLLGLPETAPGQRSQDVPPSILAQAYFGTAQDIAGQKPGSGGINFGRMNPFLNAVTQAERPEQLFGLFSPVFQAEIDQISQKSTFTGRTWRIGGLPTPAENERPKDYFGDPSPFAAFLDQFNASIPNPAHLIGVGPAAFTQGSPRGRIFERQLLSLAPPYQMLQSQLLAPSSSDDALIWSQRPMQYKSPEAQAGVEKSRKQKRDQGVLKGLVRQALPLAGFIHGIGPQPTISPTILKRELEKEKAQAKRRGGGGGGGGGWYGGGGGGGSKKGWY